MAPDPARSEASRNAAPENARSPRVRAERWTHTAERDDPNQRFFIYVLCPCENCDGRGWLEPRRETPCPDCRKEGRVLTLVATCAKQAGIGASIFTLANEGAFDECPIGVLDTHPDPDGRKWLISPWLPSPRNVSDAGRVLAKSKGKGNTQ
jgi:hypothetical protein